MSKTTTTATTATTGGSERVETHYEETDDGRLVLVPGDPTRAQHVVGWITWYLPELAGVLVPAGVAVAATPCAWVVSGAVAAWWAVRAARRAREQAALRAGHDQPATPGAEPDAAEADADTAETCVLADVVADVPAGRVERVEGDVAASDAASDASSDAVGVWL